MVVNGSLSKTAVNGGAGARSQLSGVTAAVLTVVTLLFLTGTVREAAGGDAGRGRDRRGDRARRHRVAQAALPGPDRAAGRRSTATRAAPTSWQRWPPCSGSCSSTRCPAWSSGSSSRSCSWWRARRDPTWRCSAGCRTAHELWVDVEAASRRRGAGRRPRAARRGPAVLRQRRLRARPGPRVWSTDGDQAVVIDGQTSPSLDVSAVEMLVRADDRPAARRGQPGARPPHRSGARRAGARPGSRASRICTPSLDEAVAAART